MVTLNVETSFAIYGNKDLRKHSNKKLWQNGVFNKALFPTTLLNMIRDIISPILMEC